MTRFNNKNRFLIALCTVVFCPAMIAMQPEDTLARSLEQHWINKENYETLLEVIEDLLLEQAEDSSEYQKLALRKNQVFINIEIEECLIAILELEDEIEKNQNEQQKYLAHPSKNKKRVEAFTKYIKGLKAKEASLFAELTQKKQDLLELRNELGMASLSKKR